VRRVGAATPDERTGSRASRSALFEAVKRWDGAAVDTILAAAPALVTATDAAGRTALHLGAGVPADRMKVRLADSVAVATRLLGAGAVLDAVQPIPDDGEIFPATPLWSALARGRNARLARFFLDRGASPAHCLWTAIWTDDVATVRTLLGRGAPADGRAHGETPLIYAARLRRERLVALLLEHGADPTATDARGRTALDHARRKKLGAATLARLAGQRTLE
jgi:ankyrin repeat protein